MSYSVALRTSGGDLIYVLACKFAPPKIAAPLNIAEKGLLLSIKVSG